MQTSSELIALLVSAGRTIDSRFPGLRQADGESWAAKVAWLASRQNPQIGRKSNHGKTAAVSLDTFGILPPGEREQDGRQNFFAVSLIRHNPPENEWRAAPHDYGLIEQQYWIAPRQVDVGDRAPADDGGGDGGRDDDSRDFDDVQFLDALDRIDQGLTAIGAGLLELVKRIDQLQRDGVPLRFR